MKLSPQSRPLATRYGYRLDSGLYAFIATKGEVILQSHIEETLAVLRHCNGYATLERVRSLVPEISDEIFEIVIDSGVNHGYLKDSRELYVDFHQASALPPPYGRDYNPELIRKLLEEDRTVQGLGEPLATVEMAEVLLGASTFFKVLQRRHSARAFQSKAVPKDLLMGFLRTMYWAGPGARSTPSAGALYPLQVFLATADPAQIEKPSLFRYDPIQGKLFRIAREISPEMLARSIDAASPPNGYVIFLASDLARDVSKYGNRGYRLAHLDAGHAAQNAYVFAAEQGLGVLEYAGFQDEFVAQMLGLDYPNEAVLISLIMGYEDPSSPAQFSSDSLDVLHDLKTQLVGPEKPVEWVTQIEFGTPPYELQRAAAVASYRDPSGLDKRQSPIYRRCQGVSSSSVEATIKAIAEAYERYASGRIRWDEVSSAEELSLRGISWVDPRIYTPYRAEQYVHPLGHLSPFDPTAPVQWVRGSRLLTGEAVHVPIELAFYPVTKSLIGRRPFYEASSSGVAAWKDTEGATERAFFELIERDALLVAWHSKMPVTTLPEEMLDLDTQLRMKRWKRMGWKAQCINLTLDSIPVVLGVFSSTHRRPHFVAGAAAASTYQKAAAKALDEAELMLAARKRSRRKKPKPERVRSPLDHGMLYFEPELLPEVQWLIEAPVKEPSLIASPNLVELFDPVSIHLAETPSEGPLSVVRVISDKLFPISFGYGAEHLDHPRLSMLGLKWHTRYPSLPHFFA